MLSILRILQLAMTELNNFKNSIRKSPKWKWDLYHIIFGYETLGGRIFDVALLIAIVISVFTIMLESVSGIKLAYGSELIFIEWSFTILFTIEYVARVLCHPKPKAYIFSAMGIVDLMSIIPTYLSIFALANTSFSIIRSIRLIRIFRILKLTHFIGGAQVITGALWQSRHKIVVFLGSVLCIVVIVGTVLYVVEGEENGFDSIPKSIYWAIVTLTTVGYGDIAPQTILGQTLASAVMIMGYAIIAVPTGIVTGEMINSKNQNSKKSCPRCKTDIQLEKANYCPTCGEELPITKQIQS